MFLFLNYIGLDRREKEKEESIEKYQRTIRFEEKNVHLFYSLFNPCFVLYLLMKFSYLSKLFREYLFRELEAEILMFRELYAGISMFRELEAEILMFREL